MGKSCNDAVACDALRENIHLLPQISGNALDLACGMGGNAILLAQESKLTVNAWDISSVAISKNVISKLSFKWYRLDFSNTG